MNSSHSTQAPGKHASFGVSPPEAVLQEFLHPEKVLECSTQFMLLLLVQLIKNLKFRIVTLKLLYKDWQAGSPLQDGLLFHLFSDCNGKCHHRRASAQPVLQGVSHGDHGEERAPANCQRQTGSKTQPRSAFSFSPNHLQSHLMHEEEEEVACAGAWQAEVLVIKILP